MKSLLILVALAIGGFFLYEHFGKSAPPLVIESPVFAEIRASADIQGREIEMAVFARASSKLDCETRARTSWEEALDSCETCRLQTPTCREQLAPRYARLFNDEPIPSAYLSATAGNATERDGRLVVYGLTDAEGVAICELMRTVVAKKYTGTLKCIAPSGS